MRRKWPNIPMFGREISPNIGMFGHKEKETT
jgi:hypothetical protein